MSEAGSAATIIDGSHPAHADSAIFYPSKKAQQRFRERVRGIGWKRYD